MDTPKPHFTPAKRAGDYIFVSGQLPFDENMKIIEGGIEAQTRQCIDHIAKALEEVGSDLLSQLSMEDQREVDQLNDKVKMKTEEN